MHYFQLDENLSDAVEGLTYLETHLLINDNEALDLYHDAPPYPPTSDESTRSVEMRMGTHQGESHIDTVLPHLYESSHITSTTQNQTANSTPSDLQRLVKSVSRLARCSPGRFRYMPDNDYFAMILYTFLVRITIRPTEG